MVKVIANKKIATETGNDACRVQFSKDLGLLELSDEVMSAGNALLKQYYLVLARLERHGKIPKGQSDELLDLVVENINSCIELSKEEVRKDFAWEDVLKEFANEASKADESEEEDETTRAMNKLAAAQADMESAMSDASSNVIRMRKFG